MTLTLLISTTCFFFPLVDAITPYPRFIDDVVPYRFVEEKKLLNKKEQRTFLLLIVESISFLTMGAIFLYFLPQSSGAIYFLVLSSAVTSLLIGTLTSYATYRIWKIRGARRARLNSP